MPIKNEQELIRVANNMLASNKFRIAALRQITDRSVLKAFAESTTSNESLRQAASKRIEELSRIDNSA